jgi:hypothetical protein
VGLISTFGNFVAERQALLKTLPFIDVHVVCAERAGDRGKPLDETLQELIDRSKAVVLLMGSRSGSFSASGVPWTELEFDHAIAKGKRVFAYLREDPPELKGLVDRDTAAVKRLESFVAKVESRIAIVPRYQLGDCCALIAMVVRDVDRYMQEIRWMEEKNAYWDSFTS